MVIIIIILGILFFLIGLSYIYWPEFIIRLNSFLKKFLFDESRILAYRKKMGIICFLISIILLYTGLQMSGIMFSHSRESLSQAYRFYYLKKYDKAQLICESILRNEPKNTKALEHLALVLFSKGDRQKAIRCCEKILAIDPESHRAKKIFESLKKKQETKK